MPMTDQQNELARVLRLVEEARITVLAIMSRTAARARDRDAELAGFIETQDYPEAKRVFARIMQEIAGEGADPRSIIESPYPPSPLFDDQG